MDDAKASGEEVGVAGFKHVHDKEGVVDQGTGGVRRPDVQVASTSEGGGRTKSRKRQVERKGGKGKAVERKKEKTWVLVVTRRRENNKRCRLRSTLDRGTERCPYNHYGDG